MAVIAGGCGSSSNDYSESASEVLQAEGRLWEAVADLRYEPANDAAAEIIRICQRDPGAKVDGQRLPDYLQGIGDKLAASFGTIASDLYRAADSDCA